VVAACFRQYTAIILQHSDINILKVRWHAWVRNELYDIALRKFNFRVRTDGQTDGPKHVAAVQETSENKE